MSKELNFDPDYTITPGDYLKEVVQSRPITLNQLAVKMGVDIEDLIYIYENRKKVDEEMAEKLEKALGISANIWLYLEEDSC